MHIGGSLYGRMLALLLKIEEALLNDRDYLEPLTQLEDMSRLFRSNHDIGFDFLSSDHVPRQDKAQKLGRIVTYVAGLEKQEDDRMKAHEEMKRYR